MSESTVYIVTDIEADGGSPGVHSMIAFGSVAVRGDGTFLGEFEAVLAPLEGGTKDPNTMKWWATQPEAWLAANHNPEQPEVIMNRFVDWVKQYSAPPIFAAHPLNFDGMWMNYYLRRYTRYAVTQGLHDVDRLFSPFGLCLRSFGAAVMGKSIVTCQPDAYPPDWMGNQAHTHRAIDDARGYASLLVKLFALSKERAERK